MRLLTIVLPILLFTACDRGGTGNKPAADKPAADKPSDKPSDKPATPAADKLATKPAGDDQAARAKAYDQASATWSPGGKLWANEMVALLPKIMCADTGYFVSCFPKSAAGCMQIAADQTKECLANNPAWVPTDVNKQTGEEAGTKLGSCTGSQLELKLRAQGSFTNTPRCNDVNYWVGAMRDEAIKQTKGM
jgi:hypothetical protein